MSNYSNSELLDELIKNAKKIGRRLSNPFTAERYIVAAINMLDEIPEKFRNDELNAVNYVLTNVFKDLQWVKSSLIAYIENDYSTFLFDDLHMKNTMKNIKENMQDDDMHVLDSVMMLFTLLVAPSEKIKSMIDEVYVGSVPFDEFCEDLVDDIDFTYHELLEDKVGKDEEDKFGFEVSDTVDDIDDLVDDLIVCKAGVLTEIMLGMVTVGNSVLGSVGTVGVDTAESVKVVAWVDEDIILGKAT